MFLVLALYKECNSKLCYGLEERGLCFRYEKIKRVTTLVATLIILLRLLVSLSTFGSCCLNIFQISIFRCFCSEVIFTIFIIKQA